MSTLISAQKGLIPWYTYLTSDVDAGKTFYTELFGWKTSGGSFDNGSTHVMFENAGGGFADLASAQSGVPPHWAIYVAVEDVYATMLQVAELGGKVVVEAFDVPGLGSMGLLQDPAGATIWAYTPIDAKAMVTAMGSAAGQPCWNELITAKPEQAAPFYRELFGWDVKHDPATGMWYVHVAGKPNGHIMPTPQHAAGMPAVWNVYFMAPALEECIERAGKLGGKVVMPSTVVPGQGTFAYLRDPTGAMFYVWKPQ